MKLYVLDEDACRCAYCVVVGVSRRY